MDIVIHAIYDRVKIKEAVTNRVSVHQSSKRQVYDRVKIKEVALRVPRITRSEGMGITVGISKLRLLLCPIGASSTTGEKSSWAMLLPIVIFGPPSILIPLLFAFPVALRPGARLVLVVGPWLLPVVVFGR